MHKAQPNESSISRFATLLRDAQRIAFLTGAGMSTESGIPDFRSASGIYATRTSAEVFDIEAFEADPSAFFDFARSFYAEIRQAKPNRGHRAIADLQTVHGKRVDVATQNIDTLHQQAGCEHVHPIHGTVETATCTRCGDQQYVDTLWPDIADGIIPKHVKCGGVYKPDIVFFGEMLPASVLRDAERAMERADLVIVLGTSLAVYPAAALPVTRRAGTPLIIVNRDATSMDAQATLRFHCGIGEVLPQAVEMIA